MARDDLHFRLRLPEGLKAQIEKSAAANNRSMTAEIVSRLEQSFDHEDEWASIQEKLTDALERISQLERDVESLQYSTGSRDYPYNRK